MSVRFNSRQIADALKELEQVMLDDPLVTVWALPLILERQAERRPVINIQGPVNTERVVYVPVPFEPKRAS